MLRTLPILALTLASHTITSDRYRSQPCKTPQLASKCVQLHARLSEGNGTPAIRLWPIGTKHLYGIYTNAFGFLHESEIVPADNESPNLPAAITKKLPEQGGWTVYGDFEVCPLERHIEGHMQAACIASATNVFVSKD